MTTIRFRVAALAALAALAACGRKDAPESALAYVPADTPYVFANLEPTPEALYDDWKRRFAPLAEAYDAMLGQTIAALESAPDAATPPSRAALAFLKAFRGHASLEGVERMGIELRGHWAFYGVGIVPVARLPLRDADAFRAFVATAEQHYGEKLPTAEAQGQPYWRIAPADSPGAVIVAIAGSHLVVTLAPTQADEALVATLLGVEPPDESLDADRLAEINAKYGFVPYGTGFVDVVRAATLLVDEASGLQRELLAALEIERQPTDPVCRTEMLGIAAKFPRAVMGYTRFDPTAYDSNAVIELEPALAAEMKSLAAPVPGLGTGDSLVDFGMSLRIDQLKAAVDRHADAIAAAPFQCASLAPLNQSAADLKTQLANPVIYAVAPVLTGFRLSLSELTIPKGATPATYAGHLVVASPNPQSLIASARSFVPPLAELRVEAGAAPVALPADAAPPGVPPLWIAANAGALAIGAGDGQDATLASALAAPAGEPPPLFAFGYTGAFMNTLMDFTGSVAPPADEAERAEMEASMKLVNAMYSQMFDRLDGDLVATDRGLEMRQRIRLK